MPAKLRGERGGPAVAAHRPPPALGEPAAAARDQAAAAGHQQLGQEHRGEADEDPAQRRLQPGGLPRVQAAHRLQRHRLADAHRARPGRAQDRLPQPRPRLRRRAAVRAHGPGREQGRDHARAAGRHAAAVGRPRRAGLLRPLQRVPPGGQRGVLLERPGAHRRARLRAHRGGHPALPGHDHGHRGEQVHLQGAHLQDGGRGRPAVGAQKVDPLLRGRHRDHLLRGAQRLRPEALRGQPDEPDGREPAPLRLHLQQQLVRQHVPHPLPEQEGPAGTEDPPHPADRVLPRVQRPEHLRGGRRLHPAAVRGPEPQQGDQGDLLALHLRHRHRQHPVRVRRRDRRHHPEQPQVHRPLLRAGAAARRGPARGGRRGWGPAGPRRGGGGGRRGRGEAGTSPGPEDGGGGWSVPPAPAPAPSSLQTRLYTDRLLGR